MSDTSGISSLGVGSGLDLSSLLDSLRTAQESRLQPIRQQRSQTNAELSAYGQLADRVSSVKDAADKVADPDIFSATTATSSGNSLAVESSSGAVPGRYSVETTQLARSQSLVADGVESRDEALASATTITIGVGDQDPISIDLAEDETSLDSIRDAINSSKAGVSASIIDNGGDLPYQLSLTSDETGASNQISVTATGADGAENSVSALIGYSSAGQGPMRETVAGQDARLNVNGVEISRETNIVEDAIEGVTIDMSRSSVGDTNTVRVGQDNERITGAIQGFVTAFNRYQSSQDDLTAFAGQGGDNGVLLGDGAARSMGSRLRSAASEMSDVGDGMLADLGIELTLEGSLEVDDDMLNSAVRDDPERVRRILAGDGPGSDGVADKIAATADQLLADQGLLTTAQSGAESRIERLNERIDRNVEQIDASMARQRAQFVELDRTIASLDSTSSYLESQFSTQSE